MYTLLLPGLYLNLLLKTIKNNLKNENLKVS